MYHYSHRWTVWWDSLSQSLGTNYIACLSARTWRTFPLRVTCPATELAWSHGLADRLVTCFAGRRVRWGWHGVCPFGEPKILWMECHVIHEDHKRFTLDFHRFDDHFLKSGLRSSARSRREWVRGRSAGSFPGQRLVIEHTLRTLCFAAHNLLSE